MLDIFIIFMLGGLYQNWKAFFLHLPDSDILVIGSYIFPTRLNAPNYLQFNMAELPQFSDDVPLNLGRCRRIQMGRAPAQFRT